MLWTSPLPERNNMQMQMLNAGADADAHERMSVHAMPPPL